MPRLKKKMPTDEQRMMDLLVELTDARDAEKNMKKQASETSSELIPLMKKTGAQKLTAHREDALNRYTYEGTLIEPEILVIDEDDLYKDLTPVIRNRVFKTIVVFDKEEWERVLEEHPTLLEMHKKHSTVKEGTKSVRARITHVEPK